VASRISYLQSLGNPALANTFAQIGYQRCESSCTGLGRRVNSRFGEPASRNTGTMEQTQVDNNHSFLCPTISRKNHREEHAVAKHRVSFGRTPGLHGQLKPQGFVKVVQHDAASPWPASSNALASRCARKSRSESTIGPLRKLSPDEARSRALRHEREGSLEATDNKYRPKVQIYKDENFGSESSIATTSDVRRQSVRDLYRDYGVERPRHLASSRGSSCDIDDIPKRSKQHQRCDLCSSTNILSSSRCLGCGHDPREDHGVSTTSQKSVQPGTSTNATNERNNGESYSQKAFEKLQFIPVATKHTLHRLRSAVFQPPKLSNKPAQKESSATIKFPDFDPNIVTAKDASKPLPKRASVPRRLTPPILPPSRAQMRLTVKQSPFLLADTKARGYFLGSTVARQPPVPSKLHHVKQHINGKCSCTDSSTATAEDCESSGCRAAYNGHKPRRHTLTCSQQKRHLNEKTDQGYVADISHGEDGREAIQKTQFQLSSPDGPGHRLGTGEVHESESTYDTFFAEYIKCYEHPQISTSDSYVTQHCEAFDRSWCWPGE
jgi:hypothetical protein